MPHEHLTAFTEADGTDAPLLSAPLNVTMIQLDGSIEFSAEARQQSQRTGQISRTVG